MRSQVIENQILAVPEGYLTLQQTMDELGKGKSTIERLYTVGDLRSTLVPRPGRKPERVYLAEDVTKWKDARQRRKDRRPPSQQKAGTLQLVPKRTEISLAGTGEMMAGLRELIGQFTAPRAVRIQEKLWLTLDESAELSGRTRRWLLNACKNGGLIAEKDGGWKIRRSSLEAYAG